MTALLLQIRLPAALACLLALALIVELLPAAPPPLPPVLASRPPVTAADTSAAEAQNWMALILARPLFRTDRRPLSLAVASDSVDMTLPRLTAIVITATGRSAIFINGDGSSSILAIGGHSGVYAVLTITPDSVRLSGPNGPVMLHPQYASGAPLVASSGN